MRAAVMPPVPLRILMTADAVGGVWTYASELAGALSTFGCQVALVTLGPRPNDAQRRALASQAAVTLIETDLQLEWQDPAGDDVAHAAIQLAALARRFAPDVVHLNGYREASFNWRAPRVVVAHSCVNSWAHACGERETFAGPEWLHYTSRVRNGLNEADAWVAPSTAFRDAITQIYQPSRRGNVIWNGIDRVAPSELGKQHSILGAGRVWDEAKNLTALAAAASKSKWPVQIAGQAALGSNIAEGWADRCAFLGELPHEALLTQMNLASIFVSPAYYEPFGLTVLEAARANCALVLSDIASFRELWDGAALFFNPHAPEALDHALDALCSDPAELQRLRHAASERAARYSLQRTARAYLDLYRHVMEAHASRRSIEQEAVA